MNRLPCWAVGVAAIVLVGLPNISLAKPKKPRAVPAARPSPLTPREGDAARGHESPPPARSSSPAAAKASSREVVQRESKIEFDERLVQGQTAAGAIYLFQRGESEFRSMVRVPESFRDQTLKQVFGAHK